MSNFDILTIILMVVFGGIGGAWFYSKDNEIPEGIAGFILLGVATFMIMLLISTFGCLFSNKIVETTEIPIIIEKINKDDLSIIVKEKDERYIVDSKKYILTKENKSFKEIVKTKLDSGVILSFMKNAGEEQYIYINIKEFKEFSK
jgi:hypothetical protein